MSPVPHPCRESARVRQAAAERSDCFCRSTVSVLQAVWQRLHQYSRRTSDQLLLYPKGTQRNQTMSWALSCRLSGNGNKQYSTASRLFVNPRPSLRASPTFLLPYIAFLLSWDRKQHFSHSPSFPRSTQSRQCYLHLYFHKAGQACCPWEKHRQSNPFRSACRRFLCRTADSPWR